MTEAFIHEPISALTLLATAKMQTAYRLMVEGQHYFVYPTKRNKTRRTLKFRMASLAGGIDFGHEFSNVFFRWIHVTLNRRTFVRSHKATNASDETPTKE